jgi:hypothetical protein
MPIRAVTDKGRVLRKRANYTIAKCTSLEACARETKALA